MCVVWVFFRVFRVLKDLEEMMNRVVLVFRWLVSLWNLLLLMFVR